MLFAEKRSSKPAAPADSDCVEILPDSSVPKLLESKVASKAAGNGSEVQQTLVKQEQQQQSMAKVQGRREGCDDPASAAAHVTTPAQPETLLKQLSKGRKAQGAPSKGELQALLAMGFTEVQAKKALQNCSHDVQRAANWLLAGS